jgi:hypothetical protein
VEWFADAIETGSIKIPDYKKTMAKHQLDDMNNQITYLNRIAIIKETTYHICRLESKSYVHGLENHNQKQQQEVIKMNR